MIKRLFILLLFIIPISTINSQQDTTLTVEDIIQNYLDDSSIDVDDSQLFDLFEELQENPINLNAAEVSDLLKIPFLDNNSAEIIIDYRNRHGSYFSEFELYSIKELEQSLINNIKPFITVDKRVEQQIEEIPVREFSNFTLQLRSRTLSDLQERKGFAKDKYLGSKLKNYTRLKIKNNDFFQLGGLIEKDPGEKSATDFFSFHLMAENIGFKNKVIVGDYLVEFGQGLALWSPYSIRKGSDGLTPILKKDRNIIPYTSSDENQFYRGGAVEFDFDLFKVTGFYSQNKIDANIDTLSDEITSLPLDGYHRTGTEISKKNKLEEKSFGARIDYNGFDFFQFSFLYNQTNYTGELITDDPFDLAGSKFNFYSIAYKSKFEKIFLNGEASYNGTSVASVNNIQILLSKKFAFVTSIRNYPRNYFNLHANGFGERSVTQNEFGIYTGFRWNLDFGKLNFYYDQFKFPFATFSIPLPSKGNEFMINFTTRPFKKTELKIRYINENKENTETINEEKIITDRLKQNFRAEIIYSLFKHVRLKTRFEYLDLFLKETSCKENGFLVFQDIRYKPTNNLLFYTRFVFFQTDSYDSRVYEFENDLTGILNNPALFGKGLRWYFIVKYTLFDGLTISAKYSETFKPEEESISSGLNEIEGNLDNRLSVQIDFKF